MRAVGIILAGGNSRKMKELTSRRAAAAMPVAGSYRAIDFTLSNMTNSHIQKVAVLTQYNARSLNEHLNSSKWWDFGRKQGGLYVFTPTITDDNGYWYRGTADAIYQNINFIDNYDPDHIIVLSGDQICTMDYAKMLQYHKEKDADCTISVLNVTYEEAKRFGIMNTDEDERIYEFEEKPAEPKSTKASMGIYIFNYKVLRDALNKDAKVEESSHDFGKNIIPNLLEKKKKVYAYRFDGYWKDVGTIQSLWEANMDMLDPKCKLDISDSKIKIFSEDTHSLPQYIGEEAKVSHSLLNQGSVVEGTVEHSVLFNEVTVEKGAKVISSVVMPGTVIKSGVEVENAIIGPGLEVDENAEGTADHVLLINN